MNVKMATARKPMNTSIASTRVVAIKAFFFLFTTSIVDAQTTNPFVQGCLQNTMVKNDLKASFQKRMCNSDDSPETILSGVCRSNGDDSALNYQEIRFLPGNWEASIFYSWINQILLSEVMGVPSTIESDKKDCHLSFYDPDNSFCYPGSVYNYDGLEEGNRVVDCTKTDKPCGHIIPDVWHGQEKKIEELVAKNVADAPEGNGLVGKLFWAVPRFLVEKDQSFLSYLSISGEENRQKLAETFKRPTTWLDYCRDVSTTNCINDDHAPGGFPTIDDGGLYFKEGAYSGHFQYTNKNNCSLTLEGGCTGHFVDFSCNNSINTDAQLYWMDIALESDGPLEPNNGYTYSQAVQIWNAAHAKKEPVIMLYWTPDAFVTKLFGTDAEMHECVLPHTTSECIANQISNDDRCNADLATRRGPKERSCGYNPHPTSKITTASLKKQTYAEPEVSRSPAYEFLRSFSIENSQLEGIFQIWLSGKEPREAVCQWVADNIDDLVDFVPRGYPRIVQVYDHSNALAKSALGISVAAIIIIICTMIMTFLYRKRKVFVYARYDFLLMLLSGLLLVSIASTMHTFVPSTSLCVARQWFLSVGNTLSYVPLLIKVSAVNKLIQASLQMRREKIEPKKLHRNVALTVFFVIVYLSVWTAVDPPTKEEDLVLENEDGGNLIEIQFECSSSSEVWFLVAIGWDLLLLAGALSLAFQTRNIRVEFNESQSLAMLVYSHTMYTTLRVIVTYMSGYFPPDSIDAVTSILLSLDSMFAVVIYFAPKFMKLNADVSKDPAVPRAYTPNPRSTPNTRMSSVTIASGYGRTDEVSDEDNFQENAMDN